MNLFPPWTDAGVVHLSAGAGAFWLLLGSGGGDNLLLRCTLPFLLRLHSDGPFQNLEMVRTLNLPRYHSSVLVVHCSVIRRFLVSLNRIDRGGFDFGGVACE